MRTLLFVACFFFPVLLAAQPSPAWMAYDSLLRLAETYPDDSLARRSWLLHQAGNQADDAGDQSAAISATERALALRLTDEINFADEITLSAFNLGVYHSQRGELRAGLEYYDMVLNRAPNRKEGVAYYQIGRNYAKMGAFAAGEEAFGKAAVLPPFRGEDYLLGILKTEWGVLYLNKNNAAGGREAIPVLSAALRHLEVYDDTDYERMQCLNRLGWAYTEAGGYEKALACLREAEGLARAMEIEDEDLTAILTNLGLAYRRLGNPEIAMRYYRRALRLEMALAEGEVPDLAVATSLTNMSTAKLKLGEADSALHYAQRALSWSVADYAPRSPAKNPALEKLLLAPLEQLIFLQDKARAHRTLGDAGEPEQYGYALATYRRADDLLDRMRRDQLLEDTRNYWRADARELYAEALAVAVAVGDPISAFYFMEKARARLLLDELTAGRALEQLPDAARERLTEGARRARLADNSPAELRRFRQLQDSVFALFPDYARASIGAKPPDPARLGEIMGDGALVQYFVSEAMAVALTWIPTEGLTLVELAAPATWRSDLRVCRAALADPRRDFPAESALALHDALIRPLHLPPGQTVTIAPDGELYLLPFGALLTAAPPAGTDYRHWPWLAGVRDVDYAFSVQLLDFARTHRGRGNGRALALAPVARISAADGIAADLELPATLRTVRHLTRLLPTDTLINAAASRAAFRDTADEYSLLHLGTHAYPNGGEAAGGFLLRDKESPRYTFTDLANHHLSADLVVIGACETGIGEQLAGEGIASLGRAFARRGAPGLIMSLWSIEDATTADLLNVTYAGLADGMGPATALARAGERYRGEVTNPTFGHPFFWAGLVSYGPDLPLEFGGSRVAGLGLGGGGLFAGGRYPVVAAGSVIRVALVL